MIFFSNKTQCYVHIFLIFHHISHGFHSRHAITFFLKSTSGPIRSEWYMENRFTQRSNSKQMKIMQTKRFPNPIFICSVLLFFSRVDFYFCTFIPIKQYLCLLLACWDASKSIISICSFVCVFFFLLPQIFESICEQLSYMVSLEGDVRCNYSITTSELKWGRWCKMICFIGIWFIYHHEIFGFFLQI